MLEPFGRWNRGSAISLLKMLVYVSLTLTLWKMKAFQCFKVNSIIIQTESVTKTRQSFLMSENSAETIIDHLDLSNYKNRLNCKLF